MQGQYRKAAANANKESRKAIIDKLFAGLSEEEQKTMGSYLERIVEAVKAETKKSDEDMDYEFPLDDGCMGFHPHCGGFGHMGRRHRGEGVNGFVIPY